MNNNLASSNSPRRDSLDNRSSNAGMGNVFSTIPNFHFSKMAANGLNASVTAAGSVKANGLNNASFINSPYMNSSGPIGPISLAAPTNISPPPLDAVNTFPNAVTGPNSYMNGMRLLTNMDNKYRNGLMNQNAFASAANLTNAFNSVPSAAAVAALNSSNTGLHGHFNNGLHQQVTQSNNNYVFNSSSTRNNNQRT